MIVKNNTGYWNVNTVLNVVLSYLQLHNTALCNKKLILKMRRQILLQTLKKGFKITIVVLNNGFYKY